MDILNFELLLKAQYCDNLDCAKYEVVDGDNLRIKTRKNGQIYCNCCKGKPFAVSRGTMFYGLRTDLDKIIDCLSLLAGGMGSNEVCRQRGVTGDSLRSWLLLASVQVESFTAYQQKNLHFTQIQIDEFWSYIKKKKENMSDYEVFESVLHADLRIEQGDYWGFVSVNPETSFINAVHTGVRNLEEAEIFIEKIRSNSDGIAPVISSDSWFYEKAIVNVYSTEKEVEYKGRGRKPNPILVPDEELGYVQVHKERDEKGKIKNISTRIVIGDEIKILTMFENATRCKNINTDYVESRNGKFRKNDARLIRRTLCHSKKVVFHNAHILFLAQVMNYTWIKPHLSEIMDINAPKFKQKYRHKTAAMKENIADKILSIKELLFIRPKGMTVA